MKNQAPTNKEIFHLLKPFSFSILLFYVRFQKPRPNYHLELRTKKKIGHYMAPPKSFQAINMAENLGIVLRS